MSLLTLPDLERLQVPANLAAPPRLRLANPEPVFLPCSTQAGDDHRERRHPEEMEPLPNPLPSRDLLDALQGTLARYRPDLQCLYSLPLSHSVGAGGPVLDPAAVKDIEDLKSSDRGPGLRRIQLLFPYLRGRRGTLLSPCGLVAGLQAGSARRRGVWRSVAGVPMATSDKPYPSVTAQQAVSLRETPGVGVLQYRSGRVCLDDERLAVPALHRGDWLRAQDPTRFDAYRSAEIARFLGYLMRQLQALGELLVFNVDYRDPRPRLLLEEFFRRLYRDGALRGRRPEEAFSIRQGVAAEGALAYDIQVAPAFPIDRLHLTFSNRDGDWQAEVAGG
jgi:hypothetical protein